MKLIQLFCYVLTLTLSLQANSVVVRHDIDSKKYLVTQAPSFLVDMPNGGHGALIASNWGVTVAHLIAPDFVGKPIQIGEHLVKIEKVVKHPNIKEIPSTFLTGDAANLMSFMINNHDIALVKLNAKLPLNAAIEIYSDNKELGQTITGYGRGTTGNGNTGSVHGTKGILRQLQNRVEETHHNWLSITFDRGGNAFELEGIDGSWDSGGPLTIKSKGKQYLVGLFCWDYIEGNLEDFKAGFYGNKSYQVRLSSYDEWITKTIAEN